MATKTKTSETQAHAPELALEKTFSEGLELFTAGKFAEAAKTFELVKAEAAGQELLNLGRAARGYLKAIEARLADQTAPAPESAEMTAQIQLNQRDAEGALKTLDQALAALPERAVLHYLKAVAFAQLDQAQESSDALATAVSLDADVLFQFRLEPDFDGVRFGAPFAALR